MFTMPISMLRFKSVIFFQNIPKIKSFLQKKCKIFERWGLCPQTPVPPVAGDFAPRPPAFSGFPKALRIRIPGYAPARCGHCEFQATRLQEVDFAFEPAGTLEVEEVVLVDDILDASASTSDAAVDDISESNDDLFNSNPARKRRKTTSKKQQMDIKERRSYLLFIFWF